jgi:TrmH family RNA methyltransferase
VILISVRILQDAVLLLPGCHNPMMRKASSASRGAHLHLPMAEVSIDQLRAFAQARDMDILCACPADVVMDDFADAVTWDEQRRAFRKEVAQTQKHGKRFCLVLGNEKKGISKEVESICDRRICIPMVGHMESLNVSVAGGILLYLLASL